MQDMTGLQTLPVTSTPTLDSPGQRIERGATTTTTLKHRRRRRTTANCGREDEPEEPEFDDVHYADDDADNLSEEASRHEEDSSATLSTTGGSGGIGGDEADAEDDAISTSANMSEDALIPIDESGKYLCPICKTKLSSQHQLTLHFRSHNSQEDNQDKGFVCKICLKVLSSASSLDRHVLVHSGERPFKCRVCHLAFTTNGNMHRHMRTHTPRAQAAAAASQNGYESSDSSGGEASSASTGTSNNNSISINNNSHKYNNNLIGIGEKRRAIDEALALNIDADMEPPTRKSCRSYPCKYCSGLDFPSQDSLQAHLNAEHAEELAGVGSTDGASASGAAAAMRFKTNRHLENNPTFSHATSGHVPSVASTAGRSIIGFKDLTFVDFSSNKFPHIARAVCEQSLHRPAIGRDRQPTYECEKCSRCFPCDQALEIHVREGCLSRASQEQADTANGSESGSAAEFFAGLDLRDANARNSKTISPIPSSMSQYSRGSSLMVTPPDSRDDEEEQEQEQDGFAQEFRRMKLSGEFPCRLCDAVYPNLRALKGHNRTHLSESLDNYPCNMCTFTSPDKAAVIRHMRSHNGDRPYECAECGYAFTTKANCERHLRNRHGKSTREDVKASIIFHAEEAAGVSGGPTPERASAGSVTSSTDSDVKRALRFESKNSDSEEQEDEVDDAMEDEESDVNSSAPLDLTVDVLDLSKKNRSRDSPPVPLPLPLNLHRPPEGAIPTAPIPAATAAAFLSIFPQYSQAFMNPYFLPHFLPNYVTDFTAEMKDRLNKDIRGLHLSGGNLVPGVGQTPQPPTPPVPPPSAQPMPVIKTSTPGPSSVSSMPPNPPAHPSFIAQEMKKESKSESSVRMVIRNGVLMPKQKQRRYRTERPFSCEYCSARFTLRSNMERHVKQQHPENWVHKQKGASLGLNSSSRGRSSNGGYTQHSLPTQVPLNENLSQVSPNQSNQSMEEGRISEQVKAAIKAKMNNMDEEDEMSKLVIDETGHSDEVEESKPDLASVSSLLDNATTQTQTFRRYFPRADAEAHHDGSIDMKRERIEDNLDDPSSNVIPGASEDEEGLVAPNSDHSGSEERSESDGTPGSNGGVQLKKRSAYSLAPNRVSCPYCHRKFPWTSSLRRHILTHTGQKPYKCAFCPLLFTTKSNCDRHLARKHQDMISTGGNLPSAHHSIPSSPPGHGSANSSSPPSPGALTGGDFSTIRHVPERPYKCQACPSSTFSTQSNLRKHLEAKHGNGHADEHEEDEVSLKESPSSINLSTPPSNMATVLPPTPPTPPTPITTMTTSSGGSSSSDNPFKCHLCEGSYADRNEAIDHIRVNHPSEYQLLLAKGALEANQVVENDPHHPHQGSGAHDENNEESIEHLRGKFPDYANRKVKCAFCLRRFWSAEDLRRHMRTHTGERPFSCDICRRRFTLKHSMLRHRKKHPNCSNISSASLGATVMSLAPSGNGNISDRDEASSPPTIVPILLQSAPLTPPSSNNNNNNASVADAMLVESLGGMSGTGGSGDLIGNLLGIQDASIIEKMLQTKSAADAAKLLGVQSRD